MIDNYNLLRDTFPGKPTVLAEVGWPSNGPTRRSGVASMSNEAVFLRRFLAKAKARKNFHAKPAAAPLRG